MRSSQLKVLIQEDTVFYTSSSETGSLGQHSWSIEICIWLFTLIPQGISSSAVVRARCSHCHKANRSIRRWRKQYLGAQKLYGDLHGYLGLLPKHLEKGHHQKLEPALLDLMPDFTLKTLLYCQK
jgi:hypothetical protein